MITSQSQILNWESVFFKSYNLFWLSSISSCAFNNVSSSKLAVTTSTKKIKVSSGSSYQASMTTATNYFWNWFSKLQELWLIQIDFLLVSKLTVVTVTPSKDFTFLSQESWMLLSAWKVSHLGNSMGKCDVHWFIHLVGIGSSDTKLTVSIWSPGV